MCASHSDTPTDAFFCLSPNTPQRIFFNGAHCTGNYDEVFCEWPPRSPDLTVCAYFLWGLFKNKVYQPPLPESIDDLNEHIRRAMTKNLGRAWAQAGKRNCSCVAVRGAHVECV